MRTLPLLGLILVLTSVFGIYYRSKNGVIRKNVDYILARQNSLAAMAAEQLS